MKNNAGIPAKKGIEGDKSLDFLAFASAKTSSDVLEALKGMRKNAKNIAMTVTTFAQVGLKVKKELKSEWTEEVQNEFRALMDILS
eukprot:CAMPEP_0182440414 /NCGR_PEP_ID=MMETSP1167-20130531/87050_1 /TAXON_ID=2988 /ORGANISM="Mallomonas Sp, Strain CCMP3275" /LENGTH=85 /DNA_ID=CAMNT_0024634365 /DNA_START=1353 /DNA_END=1610 /DNA_ORIENTATION=-